MSQSTFMSAQTSERAASHILPKSYILPNLVISSPAVSELLTPGRRPLCPVSRARWRQLMSGVAAPICR